MTSSCYSGGSDTEVVHCHLPPAMMGNSAGRVAVNNGRNDGGIGCRRWVGCRVTFLMVNAKRLTLPADGRKFSDFAALLEGNHWPSLVVVTEVNGIARKSDLISSFGSCVSGRYHILYTLRSVALTGSRRRAVILLEGALHYLYTSVSMLMYVRSAYQVLRVRIKSGLMDICGYTDLSRH